MKAEHQMIELLTELREKYRLAALTNLTEQRYVADVEMGLYDYFDFQVLSYKEGLKKPDSNFFHRALKITNAQPDEVIFIDDQEKNTSTAAKIGIKSIQFIDYQSLIRELAKFAVVV